MKKSLICLFLFIISFSSYSQISFEDGYYVTNSNQKINCQIKNIDWIDTPTQFKYRLSEDAVPKTLTIDSVKEFGIDNESRYVRFTVDIDRSAEKTEKLSKNKNPEFHKEQLFLKLLIKGKASLYVYKEYGLWRFFYSVNDSEVVQLVYKKFLKDHKIGENNYYKQQLWNNLKCREIDQSDLEKTSYNQKDLTALFIKYNKCKNVQPIDFEHKPERNAFNLNIRPGVNNSSLELTDVVRKYDMRFEETGFRIGAEMEFILPFNKNKWAIIIEPTYQYFKTEKEVPFQYISPVKVDYKSIEIPIGLRYYLFLNPKSKLFVNASAVYDLPMNSQISFPFVPDVPITSRNNLAFGLGYKYNKKYSIEIRYQTGREILGDSEDWNSKYTTASILLGYTLF